MAAICRRPYNYRVPSLHRDGRTHRKEVAMQNDRTRGSNVNGGATTLPVAA